MNSLFKLTDGKRRLCPELFEATKTDGRARQHRVEKMKTQDDIIMIYKKKLRFELRKALGKDFIYSFNFSCF